MSQEINIRPDLSKEEKYEALIPQIKALISGENDVIANVSNIIAAIKHTMNYFWVGIYRVQIKDTNEELVLGPFQGPVACTRIKFGKGVCGKAWEDSKAIIVDDVNQFPGHIACSSLSRSEIVVPVFRNDKVVAVLDVDSTDLSAFDAVDKKYLEEICNILSGVL
ncbi:MAG TPA: GAF domain-containing protein [Bacteroidia bacterium]|nr:GAF domain-containing protein [Bacteroidia bacterium]